MTHYPKYLYLHPTIQPSNHPTIQPSNHPIIQLHQIFVGEPREVEYKGKLIPTGIFKEEVSGSIAVNTLNLEGDRQADLRVHGGIYKAVYAYPREHYDWWKEHLPEVDFRAGLFGENLSVSGLDEQVRIGDEFAIGTARFRVTSPRLPCFKLGIKMGHPGFVRDFLIAQRTGFYFQVMQEGNIQPGDAIEQIQEESYPLTVHEIVRLYSTDRKNKALLEKAIQAPKLEFSWVEFFRQKLENL